MGGDSQIRHAQRLAPTGGVIDNQVLTLGGPVVEGSKAYLDRMLAEFHQ